MTEMAPARKGTERRKELVEECLLWTGEVNTGSFMIEELAWDIKEAELAAVEAEVESADSIEGFRDIFWYQKKLRSECVEFKTKERIAPTSKFSGLGKAQRTDEQFSSSISDEEEKCGQRKLFLCFAQPG